MTSYSCNLNQMAKNIIRILLLAVSIITSLVTAADTAIDIRADRPGATINRHIYGQFMEHLGRGIYEGIWVGEDSDIDNINGFRTDVVNALRELHVPVLRWPGGCFADEYHWRDGIGSAGERKRTVNTNWGGVVDSNAFGSHEFMAFAELIGAEVYINGNLGTGSPMEMAQWLEYLTSDAPGTLADLRRANGRDRPWRVQYFAIGNESWGCGGNMTPAYYTDLYRHYTTFLKTPAGNMPEFIASGGHTDRTDWTEYLIRHVGTGVRMNGIGHHYYTLPSGDWNTDKGAALGFGEDAWFSTLQQTLRLEGFIRDNVEILDRYDPEQKVGLYIDEWGAWYDPVEGDNPGFLYQQNSLRDAVLASLNFHIFHRYAGRVRMANIAQMVNVLQAMILTDGEKMLRTPTYHVFRMYVPFQDAALVPVRIRGGGKYRHGNGGIDKISATAAIGSDGRLYLAVTNTDPHDGEQLTVSTGNRLAGAAGELLTHADMDGHNSFEHPDAVQPRSVNMNAIDGHLEFELPAKSVAVFALE